MLTPGTRIGDWVVEAPIGEGAMGSVYRCHSTLSGRIRAAVKVVRAHDIGEHRERFVREVELLAALRHDAVVRVLGFGEDPLNQGLYLAMELLEGADLAAHLAAGPLSVARACRALAPVADGLASAHAVGIFHRDVKPSNIFLGPNGAGKLIDFGIAVDVNQTRLTATNVVPGTLDFLPPEVFEEGSVEPGAWDTYALGLVLYEALTGRRAFAGPSGGSPQAQQARVIRMKLEQRALDPGPGFPPALRVTVSRMTDPAPERRRTDLVAVARLLEDVAADAERATPASAAARGGIPARATATRSTAGVVYGLAALTMLVVGGALVFASSAWVLSWYVGSERESASVVPTSDVGGAPEATPPGPGGEESPAPAAPENNQTTKLSEPTAGAEAHATASTGASKPIATSLASREAETDAAPVDGLPGPTTPPMPTGAETAGSPKAAVASLRVQSDPDGASVSIDDTTAGKTPLTVDVPYGKHTLKLEREGYTTESRDVNVRVRELTIPFTLKPATAGGQVNVYVYGPSGYRVAVNGRESSLPVSLQLAEGATRFELRGPQGEACVHMRDIRYSQVGRPITVTFDDCP